MTKWKSYKLFVSWANKQGWFQYYVTEYASEDKRYGWVSPTGQEVSVKVDSDGYITELSTMVYTYTE